MKSVFWGLFFLFLSGLAKLDASDCRTRVYQFLSLKLHEPARADREKLLALAFKLDFKNPEEALRYGIELLDGKLNIHSVGFVIESLQSAGSKIDRSTAESLVRLMHFQLHLGRNPYIRNLAVELVGGHILREPKALLSIASVLDDQSPDSIKSAYWYFLLEAVKWALESPNIDEKSKKEILWNLHLLRVDYMSVARSALALEFRYLKHEVEVVSRRLSSQSPIAVEEAPAELSRLVSDLMAAELKPEDLKSLEDLQTKSSVLAYRWESLRGVLAATARTLDEFSENAQPPRMYWAEFYSEYDQIAALRWLGLSLLENVKAMKASPNFRYSGRLQNESQNLHSLSEELIDIAWKRALELRVNADDYEKLSKLILIVKLLESWRAELDSSRDEFDSSLGFSRSAHYLDPRILPLLAEAKLFESLSDRQSFEMRMEFLAEVSEFLIDSFELPSEWIAAPDWKALSKPLYRDPEIVVPPEYLLHSELKDRLRLYQGAKDKESFDRIENFARHLLFVFGQIEARLRHQQLTDLDRFILHKRLYRILLIRKSLLETLQTDEFSRPIITELQNMEIREPSVFLTAGARTLEDFGVRRQMIESLSSQGLSLGGIAIETLEHWGRVSTAAEIDWLRLLEISRKP